MARKRKNVENETQILFDQVSEQKYSKTWKMRNAHWWTWIMARKLKNVENETQTLFKLNWQDTLKNGENEKYTLQNLDYGKNTENHVKWETST